VLVALTKTLPLKWTSPVSVNFSSPSRRGFFSLFFSSASLALGPHFPTAACLDGRLQLAQVGLLLPEQRDPVLQVAAVLSSAGLLQEHVAAQRPGSLDVFDLVIAIL
jgi:hypothetical protein